MSGIDTIPIDLAVDSRENSRAINVPTLGMIRWMVDLTMTMIGGQEEIPEIVLLEITKGTDLITKEFRAITEIEGIT